MDRDAVGVHLQFEGTRLEGVPSGVLELHHHDRSPRKAVTWLSFFLLYPSNFVMPEGPVCLRSRFHELHQPSKLSSPSQMKGITIFR
jgi:hypothetical protein